MHQALASSSLSQIATSWITMLPESSGRNAPTVCGVWNVIDFDKRDLADVLALVNDINNAYKYVTFTVDLTDYSITAKLDAPLRDCEEAGEIAFDGLWYIVKICDEAYPELEFYAK